MNAASEATGELEKVLAYRNQDVVESFCATFGLDEAEGQDIFSELMKFLWLSQTSTEEEVKSIDPPITIIDEMWHTFILFTKEYFAFCKQHFGRYVHHAPTTEAERRKFREELNEERKKEIVAEKRRRYELIYDRLGRETFIKWFHRFPDVYSNEAIRKMRKK